MELALAAGIAAMSSKIAKRMMSRVDEMVSRASSATKRVRWRDLPAKF